MGLARFAVLSISAAFLLCACAVKAPLPPESLEEQMVALSAFGKNANGGLDRLAYSQADLEARNFIMGLMQNAGLDVRIDAAGNIIGRAGGSGTNLRPLMIGSHIDSVPNGGHYDGSVGVLTSIWVARQLNLAGETLRHPLEVVVFANEEGGLTGSKAMIGALPNEAMTANSLSGLSVAEGIARIGGNPEKIDEAKRESCSVAGYVELHIEQGAVLYDENVEIGVVNGMVGVRQWRVSIDGISSPAGTTPMDKRRDPVLAAADFIQLVHSSIRSEEGSQVGTVGRIEAEPGAPDMIADRVILSLEIRDLERGKIGRMFEKIRFGSMAIAREHGTAIEYRELDIASPPASSNDNVRELIENSAHNLGLSTRTMQSGVRHDAQNMAQITPVGMIFIPSVNGISHSPREYSRPEDVTSGANVLLDTVRALDQNPPDCILPAGHGH